MKLTRGISSPARLLGQSSISGTPETRVEHLPAPMCSPSKGGGRAAGCHLDGEQGRGVTVASGALAREDAGWGWPRVRSGGAPCDPEPGAGQRGLLALRPKGRMEVTRRGREEKPPLEETAACAKAPGQKRAGEKAGWPGPRG